MPFPRRSHIRAKYSSSSTVKGECQPALERSQGGKVSGGLSSVHNSKKKISEK